MNRLDIALTVNHIAIQTDDVEGTIAWYKEFLDSSVEWELDEFSDLTRSRLPGIGRLAELRAGDVRLHVFDRTEHSGHGPGPLDHQFQHVGIVVDDVEHLAALRDRWLRAKEATQVTWQREEPPSDIVIDSSGMSSLYVLDPNGLEFEFLHFAEADS
ncbi:VOC family protein [Actinokineospora cianjurensis]|uniref:Catechol 2,3-dioxygenase-like lactoylglutathione lyase family enzyme n=1 Tax=Actinokineospora cianjurensis TaxID=585224 RepID=A0A421B1C0_9PSEU|nr:VOC family protein [Actinokineospora cianjurensis]RLK58184.1 catechol 2,3-dioxygenase-like lactoylglutathione lyase family enzyme [Actinokineospora cianjurensis]